MDEFIRLPKPYHPLSTTCDEILSWMIESWRKNHLVSDGICNIVNLESPEEVTRTPNNVCRVFFNI